MTETTCIPSVPREPLVRCAKAPTRLCCIDPGPVLIRLVLTLQVQVQIQLRSLPLSASHIFLPQGFLLLLVQLSRDVTLFLRLCRSFQFRWNLSLVTRNVVRMPFWILGAVTLMTEHLMRDLGVCGKRTTINLTILNADSVPTSCFAVSNLEVCGFTESVFVTLPVVFSQESMPVSRDQVPSQEDLNRWTYLSHIAVPALDAEVGILIGNNVPKATEPWEVVNSLGDGPYEVRSLLGWSVNGSLRCVSVEDGQCPLVSSWWVVRSRC